MAIFFFYDCFLFFMAVFLLIESFSFFTTTFYGHFFFFLQPFFLYNHLCYFTILVGSYILGSYILGMNIFKFAIKKSCSKKLLNTILVCKFATKYLPNPYGIYTPIRSTTLLQHVYGIPMVSTHLWHLQLCYKISMQSTTLYGHYGLYQNSQGLLMVEMMMNLKMITWLTMTKMGCQMSEMGWRRRSWKLLRIVWNQSDMCWQR